MINSEEMLFVVDENNNPIKPETREYTHSNGLWHRTAHIFIVDGHGNILCQQRSLKKDQSPGKWEPFFGGHLAAGVSYVDGALTELEEELGIDVTKENMNEYIVYKYLRSKEFCGVYYTSWSGNTKTLKIEKDEVEKVEWLPIEEVLTHYKPSKDPIWTQIGYEADLLDFLLAKK